MEQEKIIAYKGFDENFKCRGFQYEVGKEYEEEVAECCNKGFHACENPMDVWGYYGVSNSRFAIVEQSAKIDKQDNKTCSSRIRIKAELKLAEFIKLCVDSLIEKCKVISKNDNLTDNGGNNAQIGSSGYNAQIGSSGDYAQIGSSGNNAQIGSSGDYAQIGSSGYNARIGSSGDYARIGSSGDYAQIGSSGNNAQIGSSGYNARIKSEGQNAVIMCAGNQSKARAKKGSWITLAEYDNNGKPVCVKTEQVDGEGIKEDTWYQLIGGEFKEVVL